MARAWFLVRVRVPRITNIMDNSNFITLSHGSGGTRSRDLIVNLFTRYFSNPQLNQMGDSAIVEMSKSRLAFTTDAFVVKPIFFAGGDIGKLAVCGTVNDLAVAGARPFYLTASFIIEEGLSIEVLEKIVKSIAETAHDAGVSIVAGDTKVVEKGACDQIFITTSGVGEIISPKSISVSRINVGDVILVNGFIADHGMAIMAAREGLSIETAIESDCAPLNSLTEKLISTVPEIKFMRDATRGGLATVLNEIVERQNFGIEIIEDKIPVREGTFAVCEMLGMDPVYVANEGKFVSVVPEKDRDAALEIMLSHPLGSNAAIIGRVTSDFAGKVRMTTSVGTQRLVPMLSGDQLPRIC